MGRDTGMQKFANRIATVVGTMYLSQSHGTSGVRHVQWGLLPCEAPESPAKKPSTMCDLASLHTKYNPVWHDTAGVGVEYMCPCGQQWCNVA